LQEALAEETEPLVSLTHLLHLCRDEHQALWEHVGDAVSFTPLGPALEYLDACLPAPGAESSLDLRVRARLAAAFNTGGEVPAAVVAHALAQRIDARYGHSFSGSFQRRSPYQPSVGDPIPLDSLDLRRVVDMSFTSPPWRLANRLDETRRIRLAGEWAVQFRVVFDFSVAAALTGLITDDTVIATCHPNDRLDELDLTHVKEGRTFPIGPMDLARQREEIQHLIGMAVGAGASIVLLPELCLTEDLALDLEHWVRRPDGPRLLVAGSFHHEDDHGLELGAPRRRNTAMTWLRGHDGPLVHDKHSPADQPVVEDIQPQGWPELRIHVSDDGCHLVTAICRDLLNPQAVHALAEVGANLVLVPAMSETLMAFGGPVAQLVAATQALVAVANNPGNWTRDDGLASSRPGRALFGHPGLGQQTRLVKPLRSSPGIALLHVSSGQIEWLPSDAREDRASSATDFGLSLPDWRREVRVQLHGRGPLEYENPGQVTLRQAAVLVLLSDGPEGLEVLLTERAEDLDDYPGQLVFPGGAAESDDNGPVATAIREAEEEVGLDAASIEVLGVLPALAAAGSGFLVHPVLAWSHRPRFTRSVNFAEVNALLTVPLSRLAAPGRGVEGAAGLPAAGADVYNLGQLTGDVADLVIATLARAAPAPLDPGAAVHVAGHVPSVDTAKDPIAWLADTRQHDEAGWTAEGLAWAAAPGQDRRDGIPPRSYPRQVAPRSPAMLPGRDFARGHGWGTGDDADPGGSVLAVLLTDGDRMTDWLQAGRALQHVLLRATCDWVFASFATQPLELPDIRDALRQACPGLGFPQMLFRLGGAGSSAQTPRRAVSDVITAGKVPPRSRTFALDGRWFEWSAVGPWRWA
jgi:8-oxo-dGTP pyrophosphatase MutT (NUDIX family)